MTVITPAKVARNLTRSFFEIGHKRCNSSDHISMSEICAWELRATLLGNQPDWKPTHETAAWVHWYNTRRPHLALGGITPQQAENQHTTTRKEAASTSLHKTRDLTNNARATAPVTGRCTRYGARHPIRRGALPTDRVQRSESQEQTRNLRDDRRHAANTPAASSSCCKPPPPNSRPLHRGRILTVPMESAPAGQVAVAGAVERPESDDGNHPSKSRTQFNVVIFRDGPQTLQFQRPHFNV